MRSRRVAESGGLVILVLRGHDHARAADTRASAEADGSPEEVGVAAARGLGTRFEQNGRILPVIHEVVFADHSGTGNVVVLGQTDRTMMSMESPY